MEETRINRLTMNSFAHAEIIVTLTYLFRRYEMKLADESKRLNSRDVFTQQLIAPGVQVMFSNRV